MSVTAVQLLKQNKGKSQNIVKIKDINQVLPGILTLVQLRFRALGALNFGVFG